MKEIKDIAMDIAVLVEKKNVDYDAAFAKSLAKYGMSSYCIRAEDKINRLYALAVKNQQQQVKDESIIDTLKDIVGYSLLTLQQYENNIGKGEEREEN